MLANELAKLTQESIEKINRERPKEEFDRLILAMKNQAKEGFDYIDFKFTDNEQIVHQVIMMLLKEGFTVQSTRNYIHRISWATKQ